MYIANHRARRSLSICIVSWLSRVVGFMTVAGCDAAQPEPSEQVAGTSQPIENGFLESDAVGKGLPQVYVDTGPSYDPYGSGVLLTNEWVLTAGHNTRRLGVGHPVWSLAAHKVELGAAGVKSALRIEVHPEYEEQWSQQADTGVDVALIRVNPYLINGSLTGYTRPRSDQSTQSLITTSTRCYGYGRGVLNDPSSSGTLRYADMVIHDAITPNTIHFFRTLENIDFSPWEQVQLEGDSGGPCVNAGQEIVGINKSRDGSPDPEHAHVTAVDGFRAWVDFVMPTLASANVFLWKPGWPTAKRGTIALADESGFLVIKTLWNPYNGAETTTFPLLIPSGAFSQILFGGGDFNGDEYPDFYALLDSAAHYFTGFDSFGALGFSPFSSSFSLPPGTYDSFVGHDFDDDGYDDLAVTDTAGNTVIYHGSKVGLVTPLSPLDVETAYAWEDTEAAQPPPDTDDSVTYEPATNPEAEPFCSGPFCIFNATNGPDGLLYSMADNPLISVDYTIEDGIDVSGPGWNSIGQIETILPGGQPVASQGTWARRLMPWPWYEGGHTGTVLGFASGAMLGYGEPGLATEALELDVISTRLDNDGQTWSQGTAKLELHPDTKLVPVRVIVFDDYEGVYADIGLQDVAMLFDRVPTMSQQSLLNAEVIAQEQFRAWSIFQGPRDVNGQVKTFHRGAVLPDDAWLDCGVQFRMISFDRVLGPRRITDPAPELVTQQVLENYTYARQNLHQDFPLVLIMANCGNPGVVIRPPTLFPVPPSAVCLSWSTGRSGVLAYLMGRILNVGPTGTGGVVDIGPENWTASPEECNAVTTWGVAGELSDFFKNGLISDIADDPNCSDYSELTQLESCMSQGGDCESCGCTSGVNTPIFEGMTHIWHGGQ